MNVARHVDDNSDSALSVITTEHFSNEFGSSETVSLFRFENMARW